MSILGAILTPHPPVLLPEIGQGREQELAATYASMRKIAAQVAAWQPDVLIVASPHTVLYRDYFHIAPGDGAIGDMSRFGAPEVRLQVSYDTLLREEIIHHAEAAGLHAGTLGQREPELDHGVLIPLYFLHKAGVHCPIVRIGLSGFSALDHYHLGQCIATAIDVLDRRAVFIASGDLSHKLKASGPYGFAPEGPQFDAAVTHTMASGNFLDFLTLSPSLCERAAECGLRSFQIMSGALDGLAVEPNLLSYEGPFGVGYAVACFTVTGHDATRCYENAYLQIRENHLNARKAHEDPWVQLARLSLETFVRSGHPLETLPDHLPREMTDETAGTFVSLHKDGQLRGCIGTIAPTRSNVAWEIVHNAISACAHDPRFSPVRPDELEALEISVDVLGTAEPVDSSEDLDPKHYGVIVTSGGQRGLLLPDLDGVDSVDEQLNIACRKAGIHPNEPYTIERFKVVRHQ